MRTELARTGHFPLIVALLLCGGVGKAHAYCRLTTTMPTAGLICATSGVPLSWSRQCISYTVVPRAAGTVPSINALRDVVDRSFETWTDTTNVSCDGHPVGLSLLQTEALGACTTPEYNEKSPNANSVIFLTDWKQRGLPAQAFGLTLVWHDAQTGEIIDADMQVNETLGALSICSPTCTDGSVDLQNIITHEAGHFLGLGHSEQPTACMWGKAAVGETSKRFLSRDDIAGLCAIYGAKTAPTCATDDYQPDRGFIAQCSRLSTTTTSSHRSCAVAAPGAHAASHAAPWAMLVLAGLAACRRRRRFTP